MHPGGEGSAQPCRDVHQGGLHRGWLCPTPGKGGLHPGEPARPWRVCIQGVCIEGGLHLGVTIQEICMQGVCPTLGGVCIQGGWADPLLPVNRMTHKCKNITLPKTSFAGDKNRNKSLIKTWYQTNLLNITSFYCTFGCPNHLHRHVFTVRLWSLTPPIMIHTIKFIGWSGRHICR